MVSHRVCYNTLIWGLVDRHEVLGMHCMATHAIIRGQGILL